MIRVHIVSFIAVAGVIVVMPGVDMALVTRNALRGGRAAGLSTALGVNLGVAVWVLAAAFGLAAAVQASQTVFDAVRLAGALYLIVLGMRSLLHSRGSLSSDATETPRHDFADQHASAFRQGLATNLLNPKMAIVFTSLLPQFVDRGTDPLAGLLVLGAILNLLGLIWLIGFALAVARIRPVLGRPRIRRAQERITGCVLVGLGLRIAAERG